MTAANPAPDLLLILSLLLIPAAIDAAGAADSTGGGHRRIAARIAVFRDDIPHETTPAHPGRIARILGTAGFEVEFVDAAGLGDPARFSADEFDVLVLPYGSTFPGRCAGNLRAFLRAGGCLVTAGGYAFDKLLFKLGGQWVEPHKWALSEGLDISTGFEDEPLGTVSAAGATRVSVIDRDPHSGSKCLELRCESDAGTVEARWETSCDLPEQASGALWLSVRLRWQGLEAPGAQVHAQWRQFKASGERLRGGKVFFRHVGADDGAGTDRWWRQVAIIPLRENARRLRLSFVLASRTGSLAIDDLAVAQADKVVINTRYGIVGDGMVVDPRQIGMFDPEFILDDVASAAVADHQGITSAPFEYEGALSGYAAVGMFGNNNVVFAEQWAKWVPVVESFDRFGRRRGTVGAVAYNYRGPYAGSAWAFFGADNVDLFGAPGGDELLADVVRALVRNIFAYGLSAEYSCYRAGESVGISASVANFGPAEATVEARLAVFEKDAPGGERVFRARRLLTSAPGEIRKLEFRFLPGTLPADVYEVRLELLADGVPVDVSRTGFAVWHERTIAQGLPFTYRDNYFHIGERPYYVHAVKSPGFIFATPYESPLNWDDEIALMKDCGIDTLEFIHVSPFVRDLEKPGVYVFDQAFDRFDEKLLRKLDALAVVTQRHRVVMKPSLFDWTNTACTDKELRMQAKWAETVAARYKNVPGLSCDLQGDIPLEIRDNPDTRQFFNEWLKSRYGTTQKLREAWRSSPPAGELPNVRLDQTTSDEWDDPKVYDMGLFRTAVFLRWSKAIADALARGGSRAPVCAEFWAVLDQAGCSRDLDYSTVNGFQTVDNFPAYFASTDLRVLGKSLGINEYGCRSHPAYAKVSWTYRPPEQEIPYYLGIGHYVLGLGGSVNLVWDWKDNIEAEFPWGLAYRCDVIPKPKLKAYRDMSLLFRTLDLKYEPVGIYLIIPDSHKLGLPTRQWWAFQGYMRAAVNSLLALQVPFAVAHERHFDALPQGVRALIWPVPFVPPDEAWEHIRRAVEQGSALYVSGDFSFDRTRVRSRTGRLAELAGVRFVSERYPFTHAPADATVPVKGTGAEWSVREAAPCIDFEPVTAAVALEDAEGRPVAVTNTVGEGKVFYTSDIPEIAAPSRARALYADFLKWAHLYPPDDVLEARDCSVMRLALSDGGVVYVLFNRADSERTVELSTKAGAVRTTLAAGRPGLLALSAKGGMFALESQHDVTIEGKALLETTGWVMTAALDRGALSQSKALLVMPIEDCTVSVAHQAASLTVEMGEIERGRWRVLEGASAAGDARGIVPVGSGRNGLELFLAMPLGREAEARLMLEKWVKWPERVPLAPAE